MTTGVPAPTAAWAPVSGPGSAPVARGKVETTGHTWDGDLAEYNNPLPQWCMWLFWITILFSLVYLVLYPGLGRLPGITGWTSASQYAAEAADMDARTKPLYDKVGYDKLVAAGIIATVGSIAYITPPVMGSISFLMVEMLSIPYSWIIAMAIGPMLLYLFGIVVYNELYVRKKKLPPMENVSGHNFTYFKRYSYVFLPILIIILMIYQGYTISITVLYSECHIGQLPSNVIGITSTGHKETCCEIAR